MLQLNKVAFCVSLEKRHFIDFGISFVAIFRLISVTKPAVSCGNDFGSIPVLAPVSVWLPVSYGFDTGLFQSVNTGFGISLSSGSVASFSSCFSGKK
jgi:hypothetical protein